MDLLTHCPELTSSTRSPSHLNYEQELFKWEYISKGISPHVATPSPVANFKLFGALSSFWAIPIHRLEFVHVLAGLLLQEGANGVFILTMSRTTLEFYMCLATSISRLLVCSGMKQFGHNGGNLHPGQYLDCQKSVPTCRSACTKNSGHIILPKGSAHTQLGPIIIMKPDTFPICKNVKHENK